MRLDSEFPFLNVNKAIDVSSAGDVEHLKGRKVLRQNREALYKIAGSIFKIKAGSLFQANGVMAQSFEILHQNGDVAATNDVYEGDPFGYQFNREGLPINDTDHVHKGSITLKFTLP